MKSTRRVRHIPWAVWTIGLTLVFGRIAAYDLGNYRPVSNDEVELMAVAYKLATQGVLGSDLYAGFFGADQHFLITLPLQNIFEAINFRLFGAGVAQARWVSLVGGVTLVWVTSWLAYRWYGLGTAIVCGLLLVAWPSNLTAAPNGLPLLGVARAARYDVLAVAFAWLAIALLDAALSRPRRVVGFALGVCCGLATLAQFLGAFVIPLVAVNWLWTRGRRGLTEPVLYWVVVGALVVALPWVVFVQQNHADFAAQLSVYGGDRLDLLNPNFYATNLVSEASRYQDVLRLGSTDDPNAPNSPGSQFLLAIASWPAAAHIAWRSRRTHAVGDRLLWSSLVIFGGLLLLVDQTKTPLYAIILVPSLCLALAVSSTAVWRWAGRRGRPTPALMSDPPRDEVAPSTTAARLTKPLGWMTLVPRVALVWLGIVVAIEGTSAYQAYETQAAQASQYLGVGLQLDAALSPTAHVLGPERWWWALHTHPYASLRSVWWQWTAVAVRGQGQLPQFVSWVNSNQADTIIVNDNVRDDVRAFPEALQQQFWTFISTCTTPLLDLTDATYLRIEVDRITRPPPDLEICGGQP